MIAAALSWSQLEATPGVRFASTRAAKVITAARSCLCWSVADYALTFECRDVDPAVLPRVLRPGLRTTRVYTIDHTSRVHKRNAVAPSGS